MPTSAALYEKLRAAREAVIPKNNTRDKLTELDRGDTASSFIDRVMKDVIINEIQFNTGLQQLLLLSLRIVLPEISLNLKH